MSNPAKLQKNTLRPYDSKNGRYFDFTKFGVLGRVFMEDFASGFIRYSSSIELTSAQSVFSSVNHFLRWLITNRSSLINFISTLQNDHTKATAKDWEDVVALWREVIESSVEIGPVAKANHIKYINTLLKRMGSFGVIPNITFVKVPNKLRRAGRPTKSLAEVAQQGVTESARSILEESLSGISGSGIDLQGTRDFLTVLIQETGTIAGSAVEHAKILMKKNAERLEMVRECASRDYQKWQDHWLEGKRLLEACDMDFADIEAVINRPYRTLTGKGIALNTLFSSETPAISLSRMLKFFNDHPVYQGQLMRLPKRELIGWFRRRVRQFGGINVFQAYLFPHVEMVTAAIIIFLCDMGANVSVAKTLPFDCMEHSADPGYKIIKGNKMRAQGKLIVNEFPIKDPIHDVGCVDALQIYKKMSEPLRKLAKGKVADSLFLVVSWTGSVKSITGTRWTRMFQSFRTRHVELRSLNIQAKMIRPSVLMQAAYDKETGILAASAIGDHASLDLTNNYIARYPLKIKWARMIREFQALFQTISIQNIKGAAEKLKIPRTQARKLLSEAYRTGLGVVVLNPDAGAQLSRKKSEIYTQIQNFSSENLLVIGTIENLMDLILWHHHLEQARPNWEMDRPERWESVWLPWLVFSEVVIEKASRGRTVKEFKEAKKLAEEKILKSCVNLPPLW